MPLAVSIERGQVSTRRLMPKVVLVGGPDVDGRLGLMRHLSATVRVSAAGTRPSLRRVFSAEGFDYDSYHLSRRLDPASDLLTVGQLVALFRRLRPHVVHTFDTKPGVWGPLAARTAGVPVVIVSVTGLGSLYSADTVGTRLTRAVYQPLQKFACHLADLTVFQNRDDAEHFTAQGLVSAEKVAVIPGSGVATDLFDLGRVSASEQGQLRVELGIGPDEVVVTMVSRVIRSKGVLAFMQAARNVCLRHSQVRFLLIGPEDNQSLDRLSAGELAELRQTITWPGPRRDVRGLLAMSNAFVLPSAHREGIPRVLLEAAAMGLPIVTTDSPGCRDVVEEGVNGFLVPVGDCAALTGAILRLVEQPALRDRLGRASRQRAVERFDLSLVTEQTRAVYERLLARKGLLAERRHLMRGDQGAMGKEQSRRRHSQMLKRTSDVAFAGGALLVTWPLILAGALAVKLTSAGPAFYRARRAGLDGKPFDMYKLRTMRVGMDTRDRRVTAASDDRMTRVGAILRRFRIDELPQFWNVLRGDMSIVGPRPEDWDIVQEHYTPEQWRTLSVRPGVVSPADVRWYPDLTYHDPPQDGVSIQEHYIRRHMPVQVAEALHYMEHQSCLGDLQVIGQTIYCVLVRSWRPPKRKPLPVEQGDPRMDVHPLES